LLRRELKYVDIFSITLAIVFLSQGRITREEKSAKSASLNAGMMANIHVFSSWMMKKALLAHGCAISAGTSIILDSMEETRLMQQCRESPESLT
jgi:hypothetical protein